MLLEENNQLHSVKARASPCLVVYYFTLTAWPRSSNSNWSKNDFLSVYSYILLKKRKKKEHLSRLYYSFHCYWHFTCISFFYFNYTACFNAFFSLLVLTYLKLLFTFLPHSRSSTVCVFDTVLLFIYRNFHSLTLKKKVKCAMFCSKQWNKIE